MANKPPLDKRVPASISTSTSVRRQRQRRCRRHGSHRGSIRGQGSRKNLRDRRAGLVGRGVNGLSRYCVASRYAACQGMVCQVTGVWLVDAWSVELRRHGLLMPGWSNYGCVACLTSGLSDCGLAEAASASSASASTSSGPGVACWFADVCRYVEAGWNWFAGQCGRGCLWDSVGVEFVGVESAVCVCGTVWVWNRQCVSVVVGGLVCGGCVGAWNLLKPERWSR